MTLELTPREEAIASGKDPDGVVETTVEETAQQDVAAEEELSAVGEHGDDESSVEVTEDTDQQVGPQDGDISATDGAGAWIDDEVRGRAAGYGLAEADLADFTSLEEFQRYTRLHDRHLVGLATQPTQQQTEQAQQEIAAATGKLQKIDRQKYIDGGYDEDTLALVDQNNALIEAYEAQNQKLSTVEQFMQAQQKAQQEYINRQRNIEFHDMADSLDPKRFGKSIENGVVKNLTKSQDDARARLYDEMDRLELGIVAQAKQRGVQPVIPPRKVLAERAYNLLYGAELAKEQKQKQVDAIRKQSAQRRPASVSRTPSGQFKAKGKPQTMSEQAAALAADPDIAKFFTESTHESGSE